MNYILTSKTINKNEFEYNTLPLYRDIRYSRIVFSRHLSSFKLDSFSFFYQNTWPYLTCFLKYWKSIIKLGKFYYEKILSAIFVNNQNKTTTKKTHFQVKKKLFLFIFVFHDKIKFLFCCFSCWFSFHNRINDKALYLFYT